MHYLAELEVDGRAVQIQRPRAAARLVDRLLAQASRLADVIDDALDAGAIEARDASLMLARAVEAARKLTPYTHGEDGGASVEDLAQRATQLRDATQELLRRTQAVDVTPGA